MTVCRFATRMPRQRIHIACPCRFQIRVRTSGQVYSGTIHVLSTVQYREHVGAMIMTLRAGIA